MKVICVVSGVCLYSLMNEYLVVNVCVKFNVEKVFCKCRPDIYVCEIQCQGSLFVSVARDDAYLRYYPFGPDYVYDFLVCLICQNDS